MTAFDDFRGFVRQAALAQAAVDEEIIRGLLGRWVSELEPAVARDENGKIIGLTSADAAIGSEPFILRL